MTELAVLQAVRLKGRVRPADLAETLGRDPGDIADIVERLTGSGLLVDGATLRDQPQRPRPAGGVARRGARGRRPGCNGRRLRRVPRRERRFQVPGHRLAAQGRSQKARPTPMMTPNTTPRCWPASTGCTRGCCRSSRRPRTQLPRLNAYSAKLLAALSKIKAGDTAWLTRPLIDSYHTVWFELHEELILRRRADPRGSGEIR